MPNSLGLAGDGDDSFVVLNLEASFAIRFCDAELKGWRTVGDIYGALRHHFSGPRHGTRRCATAMAFYRLRQAFSDLGVDGRLSPEARLNQLRTLSAKALFRELETRTHLRLPRVPVALLGAVGMLALLGGIVMLGMLIARPSLWWVPPVLAMIGFAALRLDRGQIPARCQTLGDLAYAAAALSFAKLVSDGAAARDKDLWHALVEVLSEDSVIPKSEIRPETLLLA